MDEWNDHYNEDETATAQKRREKKQCWMWWLNVLCVAIRCNQKLYI